jgi:hypothetical protein
VTAHAGRERGAVLVVAPRFPCLGRFGGASIQAKLQVMTNRGGAASLTNLDSIINSPLPDPPLRSGHEDAGPMAAYHLESFLKRHGYRAASLVDWGDCAVLERAMRCDPIAVFLSTTFITEPAVLVACLEELRAVAGATPIVVGGPFVHKQGRLLRRSGGRRARALAEFGVAEADHLLFAPGRPAVLDGCVFVAEPQGERTALRVLERLERGARAPEGLDDIPNLVLRDAAGGWIHTRREPEPLELDTEFTRWDLVDEMPFVVPLRTSVGCLGRCRFCDFRSMHARFYKRDIGSVIDEMRLATARGAVFFNVMDDDVFTHGGQGRALAEGILRAELRVRWGSLFRPDHVSDDDARVACASGFWFGFAGIESGSREQLARMGKDMDPQAAARGLAALAAHGARIDMTLVVGFPGETAETLDATAELVDGVARGLQGYATYELFPFVLLPGTVADTPVFRRRFHLEGRGLLWSHATGNIGKAIVSDTRYVFRKVGATSYFYGHDDVPSSWTPARRDAAFTSRNDLAHAFLDGAADHEIQARSDALIRHVADPRPDRVPPAWTEILAPRGAQPRRVGNR